MVGRDSDVNTIANRTGLPAELLSEAENFKDGGDTIFPDNLVAVSVFRDMSTQWRTGPGGIIGFDYNVLPFIFRTRKIPRNDREDVFDCVQIMERAAVSAIQNKD